jgi:hypothetical protein
MLRSVMDCHRFLVQQSFPAVPRHSVALGRVWWWAQNWAQSSRHCLAIATRRIVIPLAPSCPPWQPGDGGGIPESLRHFFFGFQHSARPRLEPEPPKAGPSFPWALNYTEGVIGHQRRQRGHRMSRAIIKQIGKRTVLKALGERERA